MTQAEALEAVTTELEMASNAFDPFNSAHEGYAVLQEEVDELWDEVKKKTFPARTPENLTAMRKEAIQVAAMALRFLVDCVP